MNAWFKVRSEKPSSWHFSSKEKARHSTQLTTIQIIFTIHIIHNAFGVHLVSRFNKTTASLFLCFSAVFFVKKKATNRDPRRDTMACDQQTRGVRCHLQGDPKDTWWTHRGVQEKTWGKTHQVIAFDWKKSWCQMNWYIWYVQVEHLNYISSSKKYHGKPNPIQRSHVTIRQFQFAKVTFFRRCNPLSVCVGVTGLEKPDRLSWWSHLTGEGWGNTKHPQDFLG